MLLPRAYVLSRLVSESECEGESEVRVCRWRAGAVWVVAHGGGGVATVSDSGLALGGGGDALGRC
jgi:hypothetical protein